jgi:hypothetical protein
VYSWLAEQPGDFIVGIYPMESNADFAFYTYLFWQRIHKKRIVNGASPDQKIAWDFYNKVKNLGSPEAWRLLKSVGVKYVIVHPEMYKEGIIPKEIKKYFPKNVSSFAYNDGNVPSVHLPLKIYKRFGSDIVYILEDVGG